MLFELLPININGEKLKVWIRNENQELIDYVDSPYSFPTFNFQFILGGWVYDTKKYNHNRPSGILVELKPGMVDFISSKETLDFTRRTYDVIDEIKKQISSRDYLKRVRKEMPEQAKIELINNQNYISTYRIQSNREKIYEEFEEIKEKLGIDYIETANEKPKYVKKVLYRRKRRKKNKTYSLIKPVFNEESPVVSGQYEDLKVDEIDDLDLSKYNLNLFLKDGGDLLVIYNHRKNKDAVRLIKNYETDKDFGLVVITNSKEEFEKDLDKRFYNNIIYLDEEVEAKLPPKKSLERQTSSKVATNFRYEEKYNTLTWNIKNIKFKDIDNNAPAIILTEKTEIEPFINAVGKIVDLTKYDKLQIFITTSPKALYNKFNFKEIYISEGTAIKSSTLEDNFVLIEPSDTPVVKNVADDEVIGRILRCYAESENGKLKDYEMKILNKFLMLNNIDFKSEKEYNGDNYNTLISTIDEEKYKSIENNFKEIFDTLNNFIKKSIELKAIKDGDKEIDNIINVILKEKKQ